MAKINVKCIGCGSENVIFNGHQSGHQMCRCKDCKKGFQLDYTYKGCKKEVKAEIISMSQNGNGIRDAARVLQISTSTVMK